MYIDEFTQVTSSAKIGDPSDEDCPKIIMKTGKWYCYMYKQIVCPPDDPLYNKELMEPKDDDHSGYRSFLLEHDNYRITYKLDSSATITTLHNLHQDDKINICTDSAQLCICDNKYFKGYADMDWYQKCCEASLHDCGHIPHGFVIRTGADGGYTARLRKYDEKIVGILITFYYC